MAQAGTGRKQQEQDWPVEQDTAQVVVLGQALQVTSCFGDELAPGLGGFDYVVSNPPFADGLDVKFAEMGTTGSFPISGRHAIIVPEMFLRRNEKALQLLKRKLAFLVQAVLILPSGIFTAQAGTGVKTVCIITQGSLASHPATNAALAATREHIMCLELYAPNLTKKRTLTGLMDWSLYEEAIEQVVSLLNMNELASQAKGTGQPGAKRIEEVIARPRSYPLAKSADEPLCLDVWAFPRHKLISQGQEKDGWFEFFQTKPLTDKRERERAEEEAKTRRTPGDILTELMQNELELLAQAANLKRMLDDSMWLDETPEEKAETNALLADVSTGISTQFVDVVSRTVNVGASPGQRRERGEDDLGFDIRELVALLPNDPAAGSSISAVFGALNKLLGTPSG